MALLPTRKTTVLVSIFSATLLISACQPKSDAKNEQKSTTTPAAQPSIPALKAKVVAVKLPKNKLCLEDGCTTYNFQSVETNQPWIDAYFSERIKKADPNAFANLPDQAVKLPDGMPQDGQSMIYVRYLGQNYNLASFELFTYTYSAGAAHGMYHKEYVIFDLAHKKHVTVADLIQTGKEATLLDRLYSYNQSWLDEHSISREKLKLSDNYYYGNDGIVFVYPVYELASYAEGLTELTLPYDQAKDVIKPEYLPSQPVMQSP
ncbi:RsiV family protein [uncultured Acinetobacter sp.]|uniref:RsiV family protein n=1 Tax=uncultured Acinetobacter sp. TaxID=165433 RepID=UPI00374A02E2